MLAVTVVEHKVDEDRTKVERTAVLDVGAGDDSDGGRLRKREGRQRGKDRT